SMAASSFGKDAWGLASGSPELQSAGQLAFGPEGIVFVGDARGAAVYAIATGGKTGSPSQSNLNIEKLDAKLAAALQADKITVNDLAINPAAGEAIVSLSTSSGPALARISAQGEVSELSLKNVAFAKATLPSAPESKQTPRGNPRDESITDLAYVDGRLLVSGLAAGGERGVSTVRELRFPFVESDPGANLEIFHAAHGRVEDYAPIRTFVPFNIDGEATVLAGFTCTPLVKFPVNQLTSGKKTRGTTVAELGNRNRPLDMIVYEQQGKRFLLMANSARGVMKISTEDIEKNEGLTEPVSGGGTAGQKFETVTELTGVVQLDKLDDARAVVLVQAQDGSLNLKSVPLP
ncbi:MAG: hypothetical protein KDA41_21185, partial [Planctomycetales bacterium]|nr:hypothetical protein [Planctomycetales bacterium]